MSEPTVYTSHDLTHVGWLGPYGIIPGGLDVEPAPNWQKLYVIRRPAPTAVACRCGAVAPMRCPVHGDEAEARTAGAFREVVDALGARPGGPLRLVPDDGARYPSSAEAPTAERTMGT